MIIKKNFFNKLFMTVLAENQMSTATNTGVDNQVHLTNAVRAVYSKEIEFKALPNMRFIQFATIKTELGVEPGQIGRASCRERV